MAQSEYNVELVETYDYLLKCILIGESGTGKSCLLNQFINNAFRNDSRHTIGVSFASSLIRLPSTTASAASPVKSSQTKAGDQMGLGKRWKRSGSASSSHFALRPSPERTLKLQIWDTAGQERFRSVTRNYYRGSAGCLLCYDITRRSTFTNLAIWLADARALASPELVTVLVGNKLDREEEREVDYLEASRWAKENDLIFVEVSSLTGENVREPFVLLARSILFAIESGRIDPEASNAGVSYGERAIRRVSSTYMNSTSGFGGFTLAGSSSSPGMLSTVSNALGLSRNNASSSSSGCC
ncbi:uncharacterized protein L969DRAFT_90775 [Mixia osmundae IAM 14324]|uniref:Ras-domain-containing protein n=1 Tax=Mixia osmundae (strain CBS 9802 / IAM 14324 / JCM 22182 / KY 12970) TaxID=764103 RepID=G7DW37_MIXOS|nr:uncharacterized protein L969DRAFT_90775 [Mixia osmundae IAM 14324]KEI36459.1 hypothetical protein L969DRAFT_90775 [Mixia osmundae IAM 14324]GAA94843.1 hypothetical protein E5Q_01497 [Mixia osmundae IAM 14324]